MVEHLSSVTLAGLAAASSGGGRPSVLWLYIIIFGILYFVLFAPMRKQQKERDKMLQGLEKGTEVVTTGGIHGTVAAVDDRVVILKIADQVKIRVEKSAISGQAPKTSDDSGR